MKLSNSTKHTLRDILKVLVAVLLVIPAMASHLPHWEWLGQIVAVTAAAGKGLAMAERSGFLPKWLTAGSDATTDKIVAGVDAAAADVAKDAPAVEAALPVAAEVHSLSDAVTAAGAVVPTVGTIVHQAEKLGAPDPAP